MSEDDYDTRLSFPVFPQMTNAQQDFVADSIKGAFTQTYRCCEAGPNRVITAAQQNA